MKHTSFLYFFIAILLASGCSKKADDLFEQSPDERLAQALTGYQQVLASSTNGWKVFVFPKGLEVSDNISVGGFSYFMRFDNANRVKMVSDFDTTTAEIFNESGFRIKAAQLPSIYFDTYSYVHLPADPDAGISLSPAGADGKGWGTDFEFGITTAKIEGDTIKLRGNQNKSVAFMVKATKAEADAYDAKGLKTSIKKFRDLNSLGYFKKLTWNGKSYYLTINAGDKTLTFNWLDGNGNVQSFTTGYLSTLGGLFFSQPFIDGSLVIPGIDFITFDVATKTMSVTINGTTGTIINPGTPLKLDIDAPKRWWQYSYDRDSWYTSFTGFTINGVVDALNMRSATNFYANIYWAGYNPAYDAFSIFTLQGNTLSLYGPAVVSPPTFTADGRIVFSYLGSFGNPPGAPTTLVPSFRTLIADPNGYYLIQTGPLKYDMVSRNGSAWITWEW